MMRGAFAETEGADDPVRFEEGFDAPKPSEDEDGSAEEDVEDGV